VDGEGFSPSFPFLSLLSRDELTKEYTELGERPIFFFFFGVSRGRAVVHGRPPLFSCSGLHGGVSTARAHGKPFVV